MSAFVLPDIVEDFLAELRQSLSAAGATLREVPGPTAGLREFVVPEAAMETTLMLFPTPQSPGLAFGEYQVVATTKLPPGTQKALLSRDPGLDGFATLGAVRRDGQAIFSSMLIEPSSPGTLAGVMAVSLLHAGPSVLEHLQRHRKPSMLESLRQRFVRTPGKPSIAASPSAWSDLDLLRLHFDLGHRVGCSLAAGEWRQTLGPMAISLTIKDDHPYFGGGLLSRVSVPLDVFTVDGTLVPVADLNTAMMLATEEPAFGAWVAETDSYSFLSFLPNSLQQLREFEEHWASWSLRRAAGAMRIAEAAHAAFGQR